ncbi:hypothetical protein BDR07DRAFT_1381427 [Suillus spraguei]|nr:hypothetical protein BDR07DRAFT_1381427 [Suillus spraguei]
MLGLHEAQQETRVEQDTLLAEKDTFFQYKARVAKDKLLAKKEAELARLSSKYSSKIASLDSQMRQTNIARSSPSPLHGAILFSIIPNASSSEENEEPQTGIGSDVTSPLNSLLADVLIQNATVGMLAEALTKANVWELFQVAFYFAKDDEYMLHVTASPEAISSFTHGLGMGPDPLELHWDMMTTYHSKWNQKIIDILCSQTNWLRDPVSPSYSISQKNLINAAIPGEKPSFKFETHKKVTSALLSDRMVTGKDDQAVWAYLQSLVETLSKDGMSSDESEHKDGEVQVFWLKKMPWRADLSHEMHIIDQQRLVGAANFTPHGSKPAKHFCNANRESSRPAIEGLPRVLYNSLWLKDQPPLFTVSNKKLQRMEIIVSCQ